MCRHRGIRRVIRGLNGILDYSLLLLLLLGLVYGCYALWDSQNLAEEATSEQYAIYKPQEDTLGFQELQSMNSDVIAWITVYDTPIDYPVVQGKDNWEYVNKNAEGEYSLTGAIFMDSENNPDFQDFNTILYGHNMDITWFQMSCSEVSRNLKNKPFTKHTHMVIYLFRIVILDWKSLH